MVAKCGKEIHTSSCARELYAGVLAHYKSQPSDQHSLTRGDEEIITIIGRLARVTVDNRTEVYFYFVFLEPAVVFNKSSLIIIYFKHNY